uniref:Uncharacterized protein n=1 Tax=Arundo donax TaxID=35708 RepID=A0A0A9D401_ARUDO
MPNAKSAPGWSDGDELIADYVDCLMSLDTNARPGPNDSLVLGDPVAEMTPAASIGGAVERNVAADFGSAEDPKEPVLSMTFDSDEAAKAFYNEYAALASPSVSAGRVVPRAQRRSSS